MDTDLEIDNWNFFRKGLAQSYDACVYNLHLPLPLVGWKMGDLGRRKRGVEEGGGGALRALPTPTLPPWVAVGESGALPPERVDAGLRGNRRSQAMGATSLKLAPAMVTVHLRLRPQGALGHTGQLPIQIIHVVELGEFLHNFLSALLWGWGAGRKRQPGEHAL